MSRVLQAPEGTGGIELLLAGVPSGLPIVPHFRPDLSSRAVARAELVAERLARTQRLRGHAAFRRLRPRTLAEGPSLHLDDLSGIPMVDRFGDVSYLEDRARLRATDGDVVATCTPVVEAFEGYCQDRLHLGTVRWLRPPVSVDPLGVAFACWRDPDTRSALVRLIRHREVQYLHPHIGNFAVWATALLLRRAARRALTVIAPPPRLCAAANDKMWFAQTVQHLFGARLIPRSVLAWNLSSLAHAVKQLAAESRFVVVKIPDSAGGAGNLVIDALRVRRRDLGTVRRVLRRRLSDMSWKGSGRFLVSCWESDVLCAPSSQTWIPPESAGEPVIEGLFEQLLEGEAGFFVGSRPAQLPRPIVRELVNRSWLLARLLQRLGWVGRCSFDTVLVGSSPDRGSVEFIECNGRWGGTSMPMTLMNRLFGDHTARPYATKECREPGLRRFGFGDLIDHFGSDLYDARAGTGHVVLYNPTAMANDRIDALVFARTWEEAGELVQTQVPNRLRALVETQG